MEAVSGTLLCQVVIFLQLGALNEHSWMAGRCCADSVSLARRRAFIRPCLSLYKVMSGKFMAST